MNQQTAPRTQQGSEYSRRLQTYKAAQTARADREQMIGKYFRTLAAVVRTDEALRRNG